jgi:hypothetical protein
MVLLYTGRLRDWIKKSRFVFLRLVKCITAHIQIYFLHYLPIVLLSLSINSNSIVLLSLGGGNTGPAVCGAYNTFTNGFNVNCAGSGSTNAVLKVTVINH